MKTFPAQQYATEPERSQSFLKGTISASHRKVVEHDAALLRAIVFILKFREVLESPWKHDNSENTNGN